MFLCTVNTQNASTLTDKTHQVIVYFTNHLGHCPALMDTIWRLSNEIQGSFHFVSLLGALHATLDAERKKIGLSYFSDWSPICEPQAGLYIYSNIFFQPDSCKYRCISISLTYPLQNHFGSTERHLACCPLDI